MPVSARHVLLLVLVTALVLTIASTGTASSEFSDPDSDGLFSLNFSVSFKDGATVPGSAQTARAVVLTVGVGVSRAVPNITNATLYLSSTIAHSVRATAGVNETEFTNSTPAVLSTPSGASDARYTVVASFTIPLLTPNGTHKDASETLRKFSVALRGLPPASNITSLWKVSYQFQTMQLLRRFVTARTYFQYDTICRNKGGFLPTYLKPGEQSWLTSSGAKAQMSTSKGYWIGGLAFDNRATPTYMCWVADPYYQPAICNSTSSSTNRSVFTYASAPAAVGPGNNNNNVLYCSRPPGLSCLGNGATLDLDSSPSASSSKRSFALAFVHNGSDWQLRDESATNATYFGALCAILSTASQTVYDTTPTLDSVQVVPPRTISLSKSFGSRSQSLSLSNETFTPSHEDTITLTATHSNQTETLSPEADKTASFTLSLVPTPTLSHMATETVSRSLSPSPDQTKATISPSASALTPDHTATFSDSRGRLTFSESLSKWSPSRSGTPDASMSTSETPTRATMTPSGSLPPPAPMMALMNRSFVIDFGDLGPDFVGGRGETPHPPATEASRPAGRRKLAWRIHAPQFLFLNTSTDHRSCFLESEPIPGWHVDGAAPQSSSHNQDAENNVQFETTAAQATPIQKQRQFATEWLFRRVDVYTASRKELAAVLPLIPDWAMAQSLFGSDAGMHVLALKSRYEPILLRARIASSCFFGAIREPAPTVEIRVMPPESFLEPDIVGGEQAMVVARTMSMFLSPVAFAPHAAAMQIARVGFAVHIVQCIAVPTSPPSVIDYPLRFSVGDNGIMSSYMGAALGNVFLILIVTTFGNVVAHAVSIQRGVQHKMAKAMIRFPSAWNILPVVLFSDVIARAAALLLVSGTDTGERGVGVIVTTAFIALLWLGYNTLKYRVRNGAKCDMIYRREAKAAASRRAFVHFFFGVFKWRDRTRAEKAELLEMEREEREQRKRIADAKKTEEQKKREAEDEAAKEEERKQEEEKVKEEKKQRKSTRNRLRRMLLGDDFGGGDRSSTKNNNNGGDDDDDSDNARDGGASDSSEEEDETLRERQRQQRLRREQEYDKVTALVPGFTHRNSRFFRAYNTNFTFFLIIEIALVAVAGFLSGIRASETACAVASVVHVAVLFLYLVFIMVKRPYMSDFELFVSVAFTISGIVAGIFMVFGFFADSYSSKLRGATIAQYLLIAVCVKVVIDVFLAAWRWKIHTERLEEEAIEEQERRLLEESERRKDATGMAQWFNPNAESGDDAGALGSVGQNSFGAVSASAAAAAAAAGNDDDGFCVVDMSNAERMERAEERRKAREAVEPLVYKMPVSSWLPDDATMFCMRCECEFNLTVRRHHCRACSQLFCGSCTPHSIFMIDKELDNERVGNQRCCVRCFKKGKQAALQKLKEEEQQQQQQPQHAAGDGDGLDKSLSSSAFGHHLDSQAHFDAANAFDIAVNEDNDEDDSIQSRLPRMISKDLWMADEETDICMRCSAEFTATNRRSHCRICAKIFCSACISLATVLDETGNKVLQNQKCCVRCLAKRKAKKKEINLDDLFLDLSPAQPNNKSKHSAAAAAAAASSSKSIWDVELEETSSSSKVGVDADAGAGAGGSEAPSFSAKSARAARKKRDAAKRADAVSAKILGQSADWLTTTRFEIGRSFDRDEALLREEMLRDSGAGRGFLFKQFRMSDALRKNFDPPEQDDDDDGGGAVDDQRQYHSDDDEDMDAFLPPVSPPARSSSASAPPARSSSAAMDLSGVDDLVNEFLRNSSPSPPKSSSPTAAAAASTMNLYPPSHVHAHTPDPAKRVEERMSSSSPHPSSPAASSLAGSSPGQSPSQSPSEGSTLQHDKKTVLLGTGSVHQRFTIQDVDLDEFI